MFKSTPETKPLKLCISSNQPPKRGNRHRADEEPADEHRRRGDVGREADGEAASVADGDLRPGAGCKYLPAASNDGLPDFSFCAFLMTKSVGLTTLKASKGLFLGTGR